MRQLGKILFRIIWKICSNRNVRVKNWLRLRGFSYFHDLPKRILASKGDVVLHAGCWQIETVRRWSQAVGSKGKVIIIEANDYSFNLLAQELELRKTKLSNVLLIHRAVWNKRERLTLDEADRPGSHKIRKAHTYYEKNIGKYINSAMVEADTIGNILNKHGIRHVDHFHITINGAEVEALEGIDKCFLEHQTRIFVYCETLVKGTREPVTNKVVDQLKSYGCKVVYHIHMPKQPNPVFAVLLAPFHLTRT